MNQRASLILIALFSSMNIQAENGVPVTDHDTLCRLTFGDNKKGYYVGSTPMEDACRTEHFESRRRICTHHYSKAEILNACIATFDAISYRAERAVARRINQKVCPENDPLGINEGNEGCSPLEEYGVDPLGIRKKK